MEDDHIIDDENYTDLDVLLPKIGEFGRYQKLVTWLVCLPACIPCGFGAFTQLFMSEMPDHWCYVPELRNFSVQAVRDTAIPKSNGAISQCHQYDVDWIKLLDEYGGELERVHINDSWPKTNCKMGWVYNTTEVTSSIVIDFNLVCDKNMYSTFGFMVLNIGGPIGVYCFGLLNDTIGRKVTYFFCLTTFVLGNVLTTLAPNFLFWAGSRFIVGLTVPALYQIPFIICLEIVGPSYRAFITMMTSLFYAAGMMMLAGITYFIRDWVQLTFVTSVPFVIYYIYWFFLPESPRWLLVSKKYPQALELLKRIARVNGYELPSCFRVQLIEKAIEDESHGKSGRRKPGLAALFKTPNMRLKTCLITLMWFANEMVYVGLSYYSPMLGSNQYLSFFLSCVVEVPSYLVTYCVMDKWGRRWPLSICMVISGLGCVSTITISSDYTVWTLLLFLISKLFISASFLIIYPFAGELYPTELRGIGIAISSYIGGLGLTFVPLITYLGSEMLLLPLVIFGITSIVGGLVGLRLPETLHQRLPQTIEEGEVFGKDFKAMNCCKVETQVKEDLELNQLEFKGSSGDAPITQLRKLSIHQLVRQSSVMDTQKDEQGVMKMTYWF